jgi:hypothetical protein
VAPVNAGGTVVRIAAGMNTTCAQLDPDQHLLTVSRAGRRRDRRAPLLLPGPEGASAASMA